MSCGPRDDEKTCLGNQKSLLREYNMINGWTDINFIDPEENFEQIQSV